MQHDRNQVVGRRLPLFGFPKLAERHAHFIGAGETYLALFERIEHFDIAQHIRPARQVRAAFPWIIKQLGKHAGGQFNRDAFHPVERLADWQRVKHVARPLRGFDAHDVDHAGGEGGRDRAALRRVLRRVHRDEHRHADFAFFKADRVPCNRDAADLPVRRENLGQRFDILDRLVSGQRPIGAKFRFGRVVNRRFGAHASERFAPLVIAP